MDKPRPYISQELQEEFEYFLMNQMGEEEETTFLQKLEQDESLKYQFEEFRALYIAVEEEGLRTQINKFHEGVKTPGTDKKYNFNFYRIAAGIALLVALGIWFLNRPNQNERLFNKYFSPDPGLPTVMGPNDNYHFYEAMVDYKQGNFAIAIAKWEKLLKEKPANDTLNYFLGVSHLALRNHKKAIAYLQEVHRLKTSVFLEESNLFLGMAYLNSGEISKAQKNLARSSGKKAKQLLQELQDE
ncbi:MAG: tetratricopeptide repeat protein [Bacteroidota bacterium]